MPRVKTPILLQLEAAECGAACLGTILEHYGKVVPLTDLRRECGVSRDGVKASNMIKAGRRYGLKAKGFRETLESAMTLQCPYIAFWNFNHFLVVEGFDAGKDTVYLNDPAHGHRQVTLQEFDDSFTGVVLVLEPGEEFEPGGSRPAFWGAVLKRFEHARPAVNYLLLSALLLTVPGLVIPAFTRIYLDNVLGDQRLDWLQPLILALLATVFFKVLVEVFKYRVLRRLRMHLAVTMSSQFFWHLLRLPMAFYSQRYSGEIASRQELNNGIAELLAGRLADTALNVIMMVFYGLLMLYYNWQLTLVGMTFAALSYGALRLLGQRRADANVRLRQEFGRVSAETIAALQSMETLKSSGQESAFFSRWSGRYAKAVNSLMELEFAAQLLSALPMLFNALNTTLIYLLGGLAVIGGDMSIGTLVAFAALMASFQSPIEDLVMLGGEIQELDGDLKRIDDVLGAEADPEAVSEHGQDPDPTRSWPLQLHGRVKLDQVSFGYSPLEPPLFESINIEVAAGQRVALVGASGSGKTTLGMLISGLYQPWSGRVLFDDVSRTAIPRPVMNASFVVVSQDIFLFEGTVRENLTLWDPTVADEALIRACHDAAILDVVLALPGGLDAKLLEGGANLSGGQRQRLEIARALVQNPSIMVLDEATSALDAETERMIDERLHLRGCTCIIVAHRLSTIRDCDEIIVLERGQIIERGTHDQLWGNDGAYAELLRAGEGDTSLIAESDDSNS